MLSPVWRQAPAAISCETRHAPCCPPRPYRLRHCLGADRRRLRGRSLVAAPRRRQRRHPRRDDRRPVHLGGPERRRPSRHRLPRSADADLFRLHLLSRRLPDRAAEHERGARRSGRRREKRDADLRHRRSRARHGGADEALCVEFPSALGCAHRYCRADHGGGKGLSHLLREEPAWRRARLSRRPLLLHLSDGPRRALPRAFRSRRLRRHAGRRDQEIPVSGGVILAAAASHSGKTTLTLALLRHLRRNNRRVASAKAGPDYIDPAFHAASGVPCLNLDAWAMRRETIAALVASLERTADFVLCEGAMGLFDGAGSGGRGSTADLAALTGWPVVLVVDVAGQSGSAAALLHGFASHRPDVP